MVWELNMQLGTALRDAEPDGSPCHVCKEVPYLAAKQLVITINGEPPKDPDQGVYLCLSCAKLPIIQNLL
jgi:hypothetical protein